MHGLSKGFYAFQLLHLTRDYPVDEFGNSHIATGIHVTGFKHTNAPYLRSGRSLPSKHEIKYEILRDGQKDFVTASDLLMFKKLYGINALRYADIFKAPENVSYVI